MLVSTTLVGCTLSSVLRPKTSNLLWRYEALRYFQRRNMISAGQCWQRKFDKTWKQNVHSGPRHEIIIMCLVLGEKRNNGLVTGKNIWNANKFTISSISKQIWTPYKKLLLAFLNLSNTSQRTSGSTHIRKAKPPSPDKPAVRLNF